ncbi:MAG: hypothetical protein JSV23_03155 [Promethearchaeota archaeon]|nr:MAG: hypothetical protein JSV23_03155 [Candidatus Lokiarchaeota archaeon]
MKSKKVCRVILRTPRMRRVRNNLRVILKLAVKSELNRLRHLESLYLHKKRRNGLTPSQQKRYSQVKRKRSRLYFRYIESTLQCGGSSACYSFQEAKKHGFNPQDRPTDLDLVWVPWLENWFCIKCFVLNRLGEMTHEDFGDPVKREWVREEFGI